jgi:acetyl-CoA synthetase
VPTPEISALLTEGRVFPPSDAWRAGARANDPNVYARAAADPERFWAAFAAELDWIEPWTRVLDWQPPHAKWFVGGRINASANCLDRHVRGARRNKAALIWEGEPGDRRTFTYFDLHREVCQFANVLKQLGVTKGDRVALYMPLIPELAIAMLACARIGAVHNVVFGGFSADALRDRINDAQACVLVTADGGYRRGQIVPLKQMADEALRDAPSIRNVVIVKRHTGDAFPIHVLEGRDHWYHRLIQDASPVCPPESMDAEDMLYILYTSVRVDPLGVRSARLGRVLVHGRYRLGHRPQLCRVRPLAERRDRPDVRRRPGLARERPVLGSHRTPRRDDPLHCAHGHPGVHAMGHRLAGEA